MNCRHISTNNIDKDSIYNVQLILSPDVGLSDELIRFIPDNKYIDNKRRRGQPFKHAIAMVVDDLNLTMSFNVAVINVRW